VRRRAADAGLDDAERVAMAAVKAVARQEASPAILVPRPRAGAWPRVPLQRWVLNGGAELDWVDTGGCALAVTRVAPPLVAEHTYITALRMGWFDYAAHELGPATAAGRAMRGAGAVAGWLGLDRAVLVGNEPVSTNNRSARQQAALATVCAAEADAFRDRHVGVRNLTPEFHAPLMERLSAQGFVMLPARVVYVYDARRALLRATSHLKRDRALLRRSGLEPQMLEALTPGEALHIRQLYDAVYLDRHCRLNAQYTAAFFRETVDSGAMRCLVLRDGEGEIRAFALLQQAGDVLTAPAVGYDTARPEAGYYRQLVAALLGHVERERLLLNYSAGAGDFKRKRGGVPMMDYTALRAPATARLRPWLYAAIARQVAGLGVDDLIARGA